MFSFLDVIKIVGNVALMAGFFGFGVWLHSVKTLEQAKDAATSLAVALFLVLGVWLYRL